MSERKYIAVIGSRQLPAIYKIKIKQVIKCLLDKGYNIASGGAIGADNYALGSLLELGAAPRGVIFSAWQHFSQFPSSVISSVKGFSHLGGQVVWGDVPLCAERNQVVSGLLSRNIRLVSHAAGLVAFISSGSRGTIFTIKQAIQRKVPVVIFVCDSCGHLPKIETGSWQLLKTGGCWENGFKFTTQQVPVSVA